MAMYTRKIGTGNHVPIINGKRVTVRPGDVIECDDPHELGSCIDQYDEIPMPTIEKHRNQPGFVVIGVDGKRHPETGCLPKEEAEALAAELAAGEVLLPWQIEAKRLFSVISLKSPYLGRQVGGNTLVSTFTAATDRQGLQQALEIKQSEDFNIDGQATGEMSHAKMRLKTAWADWQYQVENDPMGQLDLNNPQGEHVERIGEAAARMDVLTAEIKVIKARLAALKKEESTATDDRAKRLRFAGFGRLQDGRYAEYDGRPIVYREGKPFFKDDGMALADYLPLVKAHKEERSARREAQAKAERKAEREALEA